MAFRSVQHYQIFNAKATTGTSSVIDVRDFRNCVVKIGTATSANLTVKAQWAVASASTTTTPPTFSSAQSVSNHWDYIQMVDLQNGAAVDGDTGFVVTGTDDFRQFEINVNSLDYIAFTVTARSAGSVTIDIVVTDNQ